MAPTPTLEVIGKRLPRVDAKERVTGQAIYPADLALPHVLETRRQITDLVTPLDADFVVVVDVDEGGAEDNSAQ